MKEIKIQKLVTFSKMKIVATKIIKWQFDDFPILPQYGDNVMFTNSANTVQLAKTFTHILGSYFTRPIFSSHNILGSKIQAIDCILLSVQITKVKRKQNRDKILNICMDEFLLPPTDYISSELDSTRDIGCHIFLFINVYTCIYCLAIRV